MHHLGPQQAQWLSCPPGACSFSCTPLKSESQAPGTTSCFLTLSGMPGAPARASPFLLVSPSFPLLLCLPLPYTMSLSFHPTCPLTHPGSPSS